MKGLWYVALFACLALPAIAVAADPPTASTALPAPAPVDIVTLKDGSIVYGEVIEMSEGTLHIRTPASADSWIKVKWSEVAKLTVTHPLPFHLKEGSVIVGTAASDADGTLTLQVEQLKSPLSVPLDSIASVNPLIQPPVVYMGNLQGAYTQASGNSHLRSASLIGEFNGRSESLRLTIVGRYVYGDDAGRLQVRNSRGTIKLDFFVTKKLYWFASAYFEQDTFQDLNLRTALASGPGYQFIDKGDYDGPWLKDMTLYAEAGLAYYNVDFKTAPDETSFRARWSLKFNWPIMDEKVTVYHFDEFFPSLQDAKDYYLTADSGVRFKLFAGFVSGFQWTLRYNSAPAPGTKTTDNLYLITLGYAFDTSRKRS
ncbi:MAG TPA: DUF481 domain-containing protein [Nitrospira sp.]|nr:DUF481 domain-containing protein [Nitrospira sp.]